MKKTAALVLILAFASTFLLASSCSKGIETKTEPRAWAVQRESAYFEAKTLDIADSTADKDLICRLADSCASEDQIALLLKYIDVKKSVIADNVVVLLDPEGTEVNRISLGQEAPGFQPALMEYTPDKSLAVLGVTDTGTSEIILISGSTGAITQTIPLTGISFFIADFSPIPNGWALLGYSDVAFADNSGKAYFNSPLKISPISGLIVDDNQVSILGYLNDSVPTLVNIQLDQQEVTTLSNSQIPFIDDVNLARFSWQEMYAYDAQGVYKFDFSTKTASEIADWNRIDLPPSSSAGASMITVLNDNTMICREISTDGTSSDKLILMKHRDVDPNAEKKVITIGGYSPRTALMEQAIYRYNTGDHEYRVQLVDYNDIYPFSDAAGLTRANAEMIIAMSSGKGDDMYSGLEMNYDLLGSSGMLRDLSEFLGDDPNIKMDDYLPVMTDITGKDRKLYQVFPAFSIYGFVGYQKKIGIDRDLTIRRILDLSKTLQPDQYIFTNVSRTNLGIDALLYRFDSYFTNEVFSISEEDFGDILQYANSFGYDDVSAAPNINTGEAYVTGQLLFQEAVIGSPREYWKLEQSGTAEMTYYGIPSVYDSARICMPDTLIGVSAGTDAPEACKEFLEVLLSDEVQEAAAQNGKIPVSKNAFENQIAQAMTAEIGKNASKPMTEESAQRYRDSVNSLNIFLNVNIDLWSIFQDEIQSYYIEGKSITDVRATMIDRVNTYVDEEGKR